MKLENVDASKLKLADLPKFEKCPCELCDDGCFDRAGNEHYPGCRRQGSKRTQMPFGARCPLSHYKGSFLAATTISDGAASNRRKPIPPPPDNEIPISFKNAPMSGVSMQRQHYQPPPVMSKDEKNKPAAAQQVDHLALSHLVPMETQTQYQVEYVEKPVIPVKRRPLHDPIKDSQLNILDSTAPIASQTTTRAHFKSWKAAPSHPYGETPSFAGHVLFPTTDRKFDTTTGSTFLSYPSGSHIKPPPRFEPSGNLKVSGLMDLQTNYRHDYITHDVSSAKIAPVPNKNVVQEEQVYTRRPMNGVSQTTFDFRPYSRHRPAQLADTETFQSQISLGNSFTPVEKDSQYRTDYLGHDINQHPRQQPTLPKDHNQAYISPMQKMETQTVTQRDFQPIDITTIPRIRLVPVKSNFSVNDSAGPMETTTMSRYHYQPYESSSRRNYGEMIPNVYIPPMEKFQGKTTTRETYQGMSSIPARPCNPERENLRLAGEHDHNTNYRTDYHSHGLSLCAAKAYTIAQKNETTTAPITTQ